MEKVYKAMKSAGSWNLALGITLIVAGCVTGIMLIVSGAKLLKKKKDAYASSDYVVVKS